LPPNGDNDADLDSRLIRLLIGSIYDLLCWVAGKLIAFQQVFIRNLFVKTYTYQIGHRITQDALLHEKYPY